MTTLIKRIRRVLRPVRRVWEIAKGYGALLALKVRLASTLEQSPHGLPGELIVSLTSYPPRFPTLLPTLQCLLTQSVKPDRVILWIAHKDMDALPASIRALESKGLEIRATEDTRMFKKIIPALKAFPDAFIVTVDDDAYYGPDFLETLVRGWDGRAGQIVGHKVYRMALGEDGLPLSYNDWEWNIGGPQEGERLLLIGVGGRLFPPGSLAVPECFNEEAFMKAGSEDMWLYWMGRLAGSTFKKTAGKWREIVWPGSQVVSLGVDNTGKFSSVCRYDEIIRYMIGRYGFP